MTFINPTRRDDILVEVDPLLDGSGDYTGDWLETANIHTIQVACKFNGSGASVSIEDGIFDANNSGVPRIIRTTDVPISSLLGYAKVELCARYFRLVVTGGPADNPFQATVRKTP